MVTAKEFFKKLDNGDTVFIEKETTNFFERSVSQVTIEQNHSYAKYGDQVLATVSNHPNEIYLIDELKDSLTGSSLTLVKNKTKSITWKRD